MASFQRRFGILSVGLFLLAPGCVHRPYYSELMSRGGADAALKDSADVPAGSSVKFRLVDPQTRAPLAGVTVRYFDGKNRVSLRSSAAGEVELPVSKSLLKENPVIEVNRPQPGGYELEPLTGPAPEGDVNSSGLDAGTGAPQ